MHAHIDTGEKRAHPARLVPLIAEQEGSREWLSANFDYICHSGPFLSHDDANIDAYRHLIPGPAAASDLPVVCFPSRFLGSLSRQIYQARFRPWKPMETYLSGCPDDAKSNFVSRQHVSRLSKVRVDDENVPPGHDWISGGRHCARRIESTARYTMPNPRLAADKRTQFYSSPFARSYPHSSVS